MKKSWKWGALALGMAVALLGAAGGWAAKTGDSNMEVLQRLDQMMGMGRKIVAGAQDLINDPEKGDKGFTAESFAEKLAGMMKEDSKVDLMKAVEKKDAVGKATKDILDSMKKVITEGQPIINKKGMGFKGFLPAAFARKVFEDFNQKSGIKGKLTAKIYRNAKNAPDEWEKKGLESFLKADWPKGKAVSETMTLDGGAKVLRYIKPEYYTGGCLKCHGEPKGERDITGGFKEGFKDGDSGAGLSFTMSLSK